MDQSVTSFVGSIFEILKPKSLTSLVSPLIFLYKTTFTTRSLIFILPQLLITDVNCVDKGISKFPVRGLPFKGFAQLGLLLDISLKISKFQNFNELPVDFFRQTKISYEYLLFAFTLSKRRFCHSKTQCLSSSALYY